MLLYCSELPIMCIVRILKEYEIESAHVVGDVYYTIKYTSNLLLYHQSS